MTSTRIALTLLLPAFVLPACGAERVIDDDEDMIGIEDGEDGEGDPDPSGLDEDENEDEDQDDGEDSEEPPGDEGDDEPEAECASGEWRDCDVDGWGGEQYCSVDGEWLACETWEEEGDGTPLVLSFDGGPVELRADDRHGFAISPLHSDVTDWPTASTPWLALDRDDNGTIDDGGELFGSATRLATGGFASNGFQALAELDDDRDGRITPSDAAWGSLRLWGDDDADRTSSAVELRTLDVAGLRSIDLDYRVDPICDARGNCEVERAQFRFVDDHGTVHTGAVIDVHLRYQ